MIEMVFGAFPQLILNIFILQGLQIQEPLNIASTFLSFVCVTFAFGDFLAFNVNEDSPFSKTVWAMFATIVDTLFRPLFIAYMLSIVKAYALIIPIGYFLLMLVAICIKKNRWSLSWIDFFYAALSFPCSALEHDDLEFTLR